jgi:two-component system sensor histidine kinase PilS (NtrC family)
LYYKIELALATGYVESRGEIEIKIKNNTIPLGISTSVLRGEDNEIRGVIAVFRNLAEVKLMEKRLRDADRMAVIGQLSAGIAHEIRNPLASISGSVEVLKNSLVLENGQDKKLLDLIIKETARLNTILTDFLSFARITSAPGVKTDIIPVINEVILLAQSHPDFKEVVTIECKHPDRAIYGRGSPVHYKQLLWNLILNSAQAIRSVSGQALAVNCNQQKVSIVCDQYIQSNGKVWTRLSVADTGPGVPPNLREKIFNPFFSTKSDGTGLGLAIVSRIVESLEGRIEFDTGPDGTVFNIYLPPEIDRTIISEELEKASKT